MPPIVVPFWRKFKEKMTLSGLFLVTCVDATLSGLPSKPSPISHSGEFSRQTRLYAVVMMGIAAWNTRDYRISWTSNRKIARKRVNTGFEDFQIAIRTCNLKPCEMLINARFLRSCNFDLQGRGKRLFSLRFSRLGKVTREDLVELLFVISILT